MRLRDHLAQPQHRNAYCLLANNALGAATGLLFWLLFARVLGLSPAEVGAGYAIVGLGTLVGVVAKGGLDTAILRFIPGRSHDAARRTYRLALAIGTGVALAIAILLAAASGLVPTSGDGTALGWALVAAIAVLLVATWLQDARFLAAGDAWPSLQRNLVLSVARLTAPLVVVALAVPRPVPVSLAIALSLSLLAGTLLARRLARPADGAPAPTRKAFLGTSLRNAASSAAEFLPGLLLAPLVFALAGGAQAAYFGMAWTAASLLFLASSALSRSTLAEMVRHPAQGPACLRRAILQHAILVLPAAAVLGILAPVWLSVFGIPYAQAASSTLALLATSIVLVAPGNLYLTVLRARDSPIALAAFPLAMMALLLALAPPLLSAWGLPGVAVAWMLANLPLAAVGSFVVLREMRSATLVPAPVPSPGGSP